MSVPQCPQSAIPNPPSAMLRCFSLITTVGTFLLVLIGGLVNPTGSSLACPDWPLCHGSALPELRGGVLFEHGHRLAATTVGLLTWILAGWLRSRRRHDRGAARLGLVAAGLVVLQGVLGGITVLVGLSPILSTGHFALSMVFFLLLVRLTWRLLAGVPASPPVGAEAARLVAWAALGAGFLQAVLGAMVRHAGAGRACGLDIPGCLGSLWPDWPTGQLHMAHRFAGLAVVGCVLAAAVLAARPARQAGDRWVLAAAVLAPWLALAQVALGVATVLTGIGLAVVTAHLAGATLLLADLLLLALATGPHRVAQATAAAAATRPGEVVLPAGGPA